MADNMYSAEEAAQILGLQVRTVRNYVREGRLAGVRIGKQYRIARGDLEAFTAGGPAREAVTAGRRDPDPLGAPELRAEVSSVVQLDGVAEPEADRLERTLAASVLAASGSSSGGGLRVEPLYDPARRRLKVIIVGSIAETVELLRVVEMFTTQLS